MKTFIYKYIDPDFQVWTRRIIQARSYLAAEGKMRGFANRRSVKEWHFSCDESAMYLYRAVFTDSFGGITKHPVVIIPAADWIDANDKALDLMKKRGWWIRSLKKMEGIEVDAKEVREEGED